MEPAEGILLVDKPAGPTSHDVVVQVRKALDLRRAGHAGTLDPFATGLLIVCLGRATRLARFIGGGTKLYEGSIRLGLSTDTDDITGRSLPASSRGSPELLSFHRLHQAAASLIGDQRQRPPAFSAKKIAGVPAHRRARRGQPVKLEPVFVTVHEFEIMELDGSSARFRALVSPGTYLRALARDLGEKLGIGACLESLRRLGSGPFRIEDAVPTELPAPELASRVIPPSRVPLGFPTLELSQEQTSKVLEGQTVLRSESTEGGEDIAVRLMDPEGRLVGIGRLFPDGQGSSIVRPEVVFHAHN